MFLTELQALTDDVAIQLSAPAVLEDEEQRMIAYSSQTTSIDQVRRDSILQRSTSPEVRDWFRKFGIIASTEPIRIPADPAKGILGRACVPVRHHGLLLGHLWLIDNEQRLTDDDLAVAMQAARHAGLLLYEELLAQRQADTILGYLLSPSEELRMLAAQQAIDSGLVEPGAYIAAGVVRLVGARARHKALLAEALRDVGRSRPRSEFLCIGYANHAVVLSRSRTGRSATAQCIDATRATGAAVTARLDDTTARTQVVLGVGDPQPSSHETYASYRQARMAARAAEVIPDLDGIGVWSELGIYRTLTQLPGVEAIQAALDPRVDQMLDELDPQVIETVERYLDRGADVRTTTDELHLSRGTLYYRLNKVEQISGLDLRNGTDRTSLHLGLSLLDSPDAIWDPVTSRRRPSRGDLGSLGQLANLDSRLARRPG